MEVDATTEMIRQLKQVMRERYQRLVRLCGKEKAQEILLGYFLDKRKLDENIRFEAEISAASNACRHYH